MLTEKSLSDTFPVFEDPYNLAKITPSWLNFQVVSKTKVEMRKGAEIDYIIRWLGLPMRWKTLITAYEPPHLFVDEQAKGPYSLWRHRHTFRETPEGTEIGDRIEYVMPFGHLGELANAVMVRGQLLEIFRFRQQELGRLLGAATRQLLVPKIIAV